MDFIIENGLLLKYIGNAMDVKIPNGVVSIEEGAFWWCKFLTSINIPEGVNSVGNYAFYGCSSLKSVSIPKSVANIGNRAFEECSSLTSVNISEGVTSIGTSAFKYCSSLSSIRIPESVMYIGGGAFQYCRSLKTVEIHNETLLKCKSSTLWKIAIESFPVDRLTSLMKKCPKKWRSRIEERLIQSKDDTVPDLRVTGKDDDFETTKVTSKKKPDEYECVATNKYDDFETTKATSKKKPDEYECVATNKYVLSDSLVWALGVYNISGVKVYCDESIRAKASKQFKSEFKKWYKPALEKYMAAYGPCSPTRPITVKLTDYGFFLSIKSLCINFEEIGGYDDEVGPKALLNALNSICSEYDSIRYEGYIAYPMSDLHGGAVFQWEISNCRKANEVEYDFVGEKLGKILGGKAWDSNDFWMFLEENTFENNDAAHTIQVLKSYSAYIDKSALEKAIEEINKW